MQHCDMLPATQSAGDRTRRAILDAGLSLWRVDPGKVSAGPIAKRVGLTHGGVFYHYRTTTALRDAVAAYAVAQGDKIVVPMLIASRHAAAAGLTAAQRARYLSAVG